MSNTLQIFLFVAATLLLNLVSNTLGASWYISPLGNDASGDGTNGNPFQTLSLALSKASKMGDTVFVMPGNYTGPKNFIGIFKSITIQSTEGPLSTTFSGSGYFGVGANVTLRGLDFQSLSSTLSVLNGEAILDGCTMSNVTTGITCGTKGTLTLTGTRLRECSYECIEASPGCLAVNMLNSVIEYSHGGITNLYSTAVVTIRNGTFAHNNGTTPYYGTCIISVGPVNVINSTFYNNSARGYGAAIYVSGSSLTMTNSYVIGNTAYYLGGGLFFRISSVNLYNCQISENSAPQGGGFYAEDGTNVVASQTLISMNTASKGAPYDCDKLSSVNLKECYVNDNIGPLGTCRSMKK